MILLFILFIISLRTKIQHHNITVIFDKWWILGLELLIENTAKEILLPLLVDFVFPPKGR